VKNFRAGGVAVGCVAALLLAAPSHAQRGSPGAAAAGRRNDTLNRQGEQYERDRLSREGQNPSGKPDDRRAARELAERIKRDFEGLQAGYNEIVLAMRPGGSHDLDSILDSVEEVKKCAARLRASLALPRAKDAEEKGREAAGAAPVEETLLMLRKHIYSFVTNPLFEAAPVLDVEQATKAGRDLDMILELSEGIMRNGRPKGRPD